MILQTGGRSLAATSTRSSPASRAVSSALPVGMTPSIAPSALMTRTGLIRICSLIRCPRSALRSVRSMGPMTALLGDVQENAPLGGADPHDQGSGPYAPDARPGGGVVRLGGNLETYPAATGTSSILS